MPRSVGPHSAPRLESRASTPTLSDLLLITNGILNSPILPRVANMTTQPGAAISKRRKFVADGVFYAELNEFFQRELAEEGYSGVEVRVTPTVTDISIHLSLPQSQFLTLLVYYDYSTLTNS